jgi:hypothetical protein
MHLRLSILLGLAALFAACGDDGGVDPESGQSGSAGSTSTQGGSTAAAGSTASGGSEPGRGGGGMGAGDSGAAGMTAAAGTGQQGGAAGAAQGGAGATGSIDFETCRATTTAEDCVAAGGTWGPIGGAPVSTCRCPAPDAGEPCTQNEDCEGQCVVDDIADCANLSEGTCSSVAPLNECYCIFGVAAVCP